MKIIFLDIDGVLCTQKCLKLPQVNIQGRLVRSLDPDCVVRLNKIVDKTNALIVLSSAWRIDFWDTEEFKLLIEHFRNMGITGEIIGHTPFNVHLIRGREIQEWLDGHNDVTSFVIIDDCSDMEHLTPKLVQTQFEIGLQDEQVATAIAMLGEREK